MLKELWGVRNSAYYFNIDIHCCHTTFINYLVTIKYNHFILTFAPHVSPYLGHLQIMFCSLVTLQSQKQMDALV